MIRARSGRPAASPGATAAQVADDTAGDEAIAEVTERLRAEFGDTLESDAVDAVVRACLRDLTGPPAGALPELVERLAREELTDRTRTGDRLQSRARGAR